MQNGPHAHCPSGATRIQCIPTLSILPVLSSDYSPILWQDGILWHSGHQQNSRSSTRWSFWKSVCMWYASYVFLAFPSTLHWYEFTEYVFFSFPSTILFKRISSFESNWMVWMCAAVRLGTALNFLRTK